MIHLSAKSEYAIKALVRLALADGDAPVQARADQRRTPAIPVKFLEQVMHDLRQGGLVRSRRGKGGGYVLAVDPAAVSFADVIDLIDGSHGGKGRMPGGDQAESPGRARVERGARVHSRHPPLGHHRRRGGTAAARPHVLHLTGDETT